MEKGLLQRVTCTFFGRKIFAHAGMMHNFISAMQHDTTCTCTCIYTKDTCIYILLLSPFLIRLSLLSLFPLMLVCYTHIFHVHVHVHIFSMYMYMYTYFPCTCTCTHIFHVHVQSMSFLCVDHTHIQQIQRYETEVFPCGDCRRAGHAELHHQLREGGQPG